MSFGDTIASKPWRQNDSGIVDAGVDMQLGAPRLRLFLARGFDRAEKDLASARQAYAREIEHAGARVRFAGIAVEKASAVREHVERLWGDLVERVGPDLAGEIGGLLAARVEAAGAAHEEAENQRVRAVAEFEALPGQLDERIQSLERASLRCRQWLAVSRLKSWILSGECVDGAVHAEHLNSVIGPARIMGRVFTAAVDDPRLAGLDVDPTKCTESAVRREFDIH